MELPDNEVDIVGLITWDLAMKKVRFGVINRTFLIALVKFAATLIMPPDN